MFCGTPKMYAKELNAEYYVKAAFLLNFTKYVEWPSHVLADSPSLLTICILGEDHFDGALKSIEGEIVKKRKLTIRKATKVEDIGECHILFISSSKKKGLAKILKKTKDMPMLTVSEMGKFCQSGGAINFLTVKKKVRLEINVDAAKRAGLKISSKLLNLSKIIKEG